MANDQTRACPICEKAVPPLTEGSAFPFCSPRCQLADLGTWLDDGYAIPGDPSPNFDD